MNIVCPYTLNSTIFTYTISFNQSGVEFGLVLFVFGFFFFGGLFVCFLMSGFLCLFFAYLFVLLMVFFDKQLVIDFL